MNVASYGRKKYYRSQISVHPANGINAKFSNTGAAKLTVYRAMTVVFIVMQIKGYTFLKNSRLTTAVYVVF